MKLWKFSPNLNAFDLKEQRSSGENFGEDEDGLAQSWRWKERGKMGRNQKFFRIYKGTFNCKKKNPLHSYEVH